MSDVNKQLLDASKKVSEKLEGKSFVGRDLRDDLRVAIAAAEQAQQITDNTRVAWTSLGTIKAMLPELLASDDVKVRENAQIIDALVKLVGDQQAQQADPVARIKTVGGYPDDSRHELELLVKHGQLYDGQLLYADQPPAVAVRIRELEAQLNAAILARQEAQQIAQEAIKARNRAGVEIRRPLLKRIRELQAQHGELVSWMTHIQGAALDMSTPRQAIHLATVNAIAATEQAQAEPVAWKHDCAALLMNDVELWVRNCPHCGKPRAAQPPAVAVPDGYVLVPIEPTQAMLCAGQKEWLESAGADPSFDMYRAMLAAAPQATAEDFSVVRDAVAVLDDWRDFIADVSRQEPEKPDYWSSCGQCERNISRADDLLCSAQKGGA